MERQSAQTLIENLLDRIIRDERSGKWQLQGVISEKERQALLWALEAIGGSSEAIENLRATTPPPSSASNFSSLVEAGPATPVVTTSLEIEAAEDEDIVLCLDFGTAMSKACATRQSNSRLYDLAIGRQAGQQNPIYALSSSIYITPSGKVHFGQNAINASLEGRTAGLRRFDSLKDVLCKGVMLNLDDAVLEPDFNSTDIPLTKGDLITLYLAFLTDMAVTELQNSHGISRYIKRRFTRPVLPPERAVWAEDELKRLLARAQIVADTFHSQWKDGIEIGRAKQVLSEIVAGDQLPLFLVGQGIMEPVAVIASRVRDFEPEKDSRRLVMVIDVGAGTIDFAMFVEHQIKGVGTKYHVIQSSIQVVRQAGDTVDRILQRTILERADIPTNDPDYNRLSAGLSLQIRQLKETLFREGEVSFLLEDDTTGSIHLSDFLDTEKIHNFEKKIHSTFRDSLDAVDASWYQLAKDGQIPVFFTGGGAKLPMVTSVADRNLVIHDRPIRFVSATPVPRWVSRLYPSLQDEYPQLSVSIGGCSRDLPEVAPQHFEEFKGLEADAWTIPPDYKGEDKR